MKASGGCRVYSKMFKRKPTDEERKYYEQIYDIGKEKYERDSKISGLDEQGQYNRISDRWNNGK